MYFRVTSFIKMLKPIIPILVLLLLLPPAFLQAQRLDLKIYNVAEDGLTTGVGSIYQDSKGWMWFNSTGKVIKYDGDRFKIYPVANKAKMDFGYRIREVNNQFWILSTPYPMTISRDSLVPLTIAKSSLDILDHLKHKGQDFILGIDGISLLQNNKLHPFIKEEGLKIDNNETLHYYNDSLLLSWKEDKFLYVFNINNKKVYKLPMKLLYMQQKEKDVLISIKEMGIFKISDIKFSAESLKIDLEKIYESKVDNYEKIVTDEQHNIWGISQYKHLLKIDAERNIKKYGVVEGLPNLWFNDIYTDREQNIWLAFNGSIARIVNIGAQRYSSAENLYFDHVNDFRSDPDKKQTFIFTPKGINIFKNNIVHKLKYKEQPFMAIDILPEKNGYLALIDSLLYSFKIDTTNFTVTTLKQVANLKSLGVKLEADEKGSVFIASIKGLYVYHQNKLQHLLADKIYYRSIYIDKKQRLWTGDFALGLAAYQISHISSTIKLKKIKLDGLNATKEPLQKIRAITADAEGNILVGTRFNGLFYISLEEDKIKSVKHFGKGSGLKSNTIWDVMVDPQNKWWICTDISVESISKLDDEFFSRDQTTIYQLGQPYSICLLPDERIVVSSLPGIAIIDNDYIAKPTSFSVFITGFNLPDSVFSPVQYLTKKFKLNYKQNNIQINFSANSFINEAAIKYSYQIGDSTTAIWSNFSTNHAVNFSSLQPGTYSFRVKAKDANDLLSDNIASVSFIITAPFWKTIWFRFLLIFAIALFFYVLYRLRLKQITRLQNMRNSISNNLHDDIGASLSNINILNEMAKRNIDQPQKASGYLYKSGEVIQAISESLSDIVWNINPRYDDLSNLFIRMKRYAAEVLETSKIEAELIFSTELKGLHMDMDERRDFYLIFKEAINNLVKHAKASKAKIELLYEEKKLKLIIEDNGLGFLNDINYEGNGLRNMQQRAAKHKARITIDTAPGAGTRLELVMKLK